MSTQRVGCMAVFVNGQHFQAESKQPNPPIPVTVTDVKADSGRLHPAVYHWIHPKSREYIPREDTPGSVSSVFVLYLVLSGFRAKQRDEWSVQPPSETGHLLASFLGIMNKLRFCFNNSLGWNSKSVFFFFVSLLQEFGIENWELGISPLISSVEKRRILVTYNFLNFKTSSVPGFQWS